MTERTPIPIAEQFYSIQGEGRYAGVPSIFLRLANCNLCCGGRANRDRDPEDFEAEDGATWVCDTIDVWREAESTPDAISLADEWEARGWDKSLSDGAHIVLTGGEPTLPANREAFSALYDELTTRGHLPFVEVETNGTVVPDDPFIGYVDHWNVSLKLSNSGMERYERIYPDAIEFYVDMYREFEAADFKFVVRDSEDIDEVESLIDEFGIPEEMIMLMPAGQTKEQLAASYPMVAEAVKEKGWRFSPRLHVNIWNEATGV